MPSLYLHECDFIKNLTNLEQLTIEIDNENSKTEMLRNLKKLTNLTTLDVCIEVPSRTDQATLDISSLAKFPNLEYLHIQPKPDFSSDKLYIYGLESLLNNSKLKGIYINEREPSFMSSSDNNLILCIDKDISFITSLPNLKYCSLTHNNLQDFTPLNQCRFLEVVAIYSNPNDTPELSEEIIILTGEPDSVTLTE